MTHLDLGPLPIGLAFVCFSCAVTHFIGLGARLALITYQGIDSHAWTCLVPLPVAARSGATTTCRSGFFILILVMAISLAGRPWSAIQFFPDSSSTSLS
jgi:hypothetical protein